MPTPTEPAAESTPARDADPPPPSVPMVRRKRMSWAPIVVTACVLGIGLAVLGTSTSGGAGLYNYSLTQLASAGADAEGREIKVVGRVAAGSVRGEAASPTFRFDLEDGTTHRLTVAYPRLLPDPFEEGRDAIVQGRMVGGVLQASNLTVKCPSRYADVESMSEAQKQKYYDTDYKQHAKLRAGEPGLPSAPGVAKESGVPQVAPVEPRIPSPTRVPGQATQP